MRPQTDGTAAISERARRGDERAKAPPGFQATPRNHQKTSGMGASFPFTIFSLRHPAQRTGVRLGTAPPGRAPSESCGQRC